MAVKKVAVTLPEELYDMVERARKVEHRSRSEMIQEAIRTHFGEATYRPSEQERRVLQAARDDDIARPDAALPWSEVHTQLWGEK
ncbi:metal-responsive CopG/Arc/MetJ family transcriptional regulator [Kineosphaera limosa]|uniref:Ribbon-helix-helix protein CopG domain-containing protein n=1 Tax=Kineosphaera limosa NBRC 100340 TaxID=1184609 RepID=K6WK81_9MICO|nr:ribbon-helix-helix protein, CopG family [Kineosphaera limosa]NYE02346.1 metal-responsive CopG/Arc/MetJ family transcriptional regulator [Kineosphaera limosa]GAB94201.1 hypothetical protein KILIM_003_01240 [Kineosphaera limosa NBRC 100340]